MTTIGLVLIWTPVLIPTLKLILIQCDVSLSNNNSVMTHVGGRRETPLSTLEAPLQATLKPPLSPIQAPLTSFILSPGPRSPIMLMHDATKHQKKCMGVRLEGSRCRPRLLSWARSHIRSLKHPQLYHDTILLYYTLLYCTILNHTILRHTILL